ncbi:MAG TPA: 16S rRNA (guanine(527)-N(7))-methyltransferase RsmG [Candidatus Binatia bacterium]|nr:16S rRNA (guanine(527)-N(7))-methyltransferase RsmG [Candidatus Binatia bacterium]
MPLSPAEQRELQSVARQFGIELLPNHVDRFGRYLDVLFQWRTHARLVSQRQTRSELIAKHIADSFALVERLRGRRLIADVGSGAGLPGIPLALVLPAAHVTLIESNQRKANFLREAARLLSLPNVSIVETRVEKYAPDQQFDAVVSRAVGTIEDLLRAFRHLVRRDGIVIAMKGPAVDAEIDGAKIAALGFRVHGRVPYRLVSGESRLLVELRFT